MDIDKRDVSPVVLFIACGIVIGGLIGVPIARHIFPDSSVNYEVNGQIGDFFGGILNPVIALLAFIWLRRGVQMQRQELMETRKSLVDTADSMKKQEVNSGLMVRISALNALINSIMQEVAEIRREIEYYAGLSQTNERNDLDGNFIAVVDVRKKLADLKKKLAIRISERNSYEGQIRALSLLHSGGAIPDGKQKDTPP